MAVSAAPVRCGAEGSLPEVRVAGNKKLLAMIELKKPVKDMTEQEVKELARHVVGQVRAQVPKPPEKS